MDHVEVGGAVEDGTDRRVEPGRRVTAVAVRRRARATVGTSRPGTVESPLANVVTSWPRASSSSTSAATIRSVPP